jgi:hypothetical protein
MRHAHSQAVRRSTQCQSALQRLKTNENHSYLAAGVERTEDISSGLAYDLSELVMTVERIWHSRLVILMTLTASHTC